MNIEYSGGQVLKQFLDEVKELQIQFGEENINLKLDQLKNKLFKVPQNMKKYGIDNFLGFNSGVLVHGDQGSGKSVLLMYATQWAFKNNWVVVQVPNCHDLTQKECLIHREHSTGLYVQYEFAQEFLQNFKKTNPQINQILIDKSIFGKYSSSGQHQEDPPAAPNIYDKERKTYWKDHEKLFYEGEVYFMQESDRKMQTETLGVQLKNANTILDIVNKGLEKKELSICAVYELMEQLYNMESHCLLVVVDQYNWLYRNSIHKSFRYANHHNGQIPPYHLSLCRAFLKFDGHLIKNGIKLCASSVTKLHKHEFNPQSIMLPDNGYDIKLKGIELNDFRNFLEYMFQNNLWKANDYDCDFHQILWMETQGNIGEALKTINYSMREAGW